MVPRSERLYDLISVRHVQIHGIHVQNILQVLPGVQLIDPRCLPVETTALCASQTENKTVSLLPARTSEIWKEEKDLTEQHTAAGGCQEKSSDAALYSQLSLMLSVLLANSIFWGKKTGCRSLLTCHVVVVPMPQILRREYVSVKSLLEWTLTYKIIKSQPYERNIFFS